MNTGRAILVLAFAAMLAVSLVPPRGADHAVAASQDVGEPAYLTVNPPNNGFGGVVTIRNPHDRRASGGVFYITDVITSGVEFNDIFHIALMFPPELGDPDEPLVTIYRDSRRSELSYSFSTPIPLASTMAIEWVSHDPPTVLRPVVLAGYYAQDRPNVTVFGP